MSESPCSGVVGLHQVRDETERIYSWRLYVLIEAGYPVALAEEIAAGDADLHHAVELVARGCGIETAAEILR